MNERIKKLFGNKRTLAFAGILALTVAGGIFLVQRFQSSKPGGDSNIPVVVDTSVSPTSQDCPLQIE